MEDQVGERRDVERGREEGRKVECHPARGLKAWEERRSPVRKAAQSGGRAQVSGGSCSS